MQPLDCSDPLVQRHELQRSTHHDAAALKHADYENVRILGHNMKGTGAGYGLNRITEIGASLEQAAARREPEEIRARAAELARYLDGLHVEYEELTLEGYASTILGHPGVDRRAGPGHRPFRRQHLVCGSDDERGRLLHI